MIDGRSWSNAPHHDDEHGLSTYEVDGAYKEQQEKLQKYKQLMSQANARTCFASRTCLQIGKRDGAWMRITIGDQKIWPT